MPRCIDASMVFAFSDPPGERPNIFLSFWPMSSLMSFSTPASVWFGSVVLAVAGPNANSVGVVAAGWARHVDTKSVAARANNGRMKRHDLLILLRLLEYPLLLLAHLGGEFVAEILGLEDLADLDLALVSRERA